MATARANPKGSCDPNRKERQRLVWRLEALYQEIASLERRQNELRDEAEELAIALAKLDDRPDRDFLDSLVSRFDREPLTASERDIIFYKALRERHPEWVRDVRFSEIAPSLRRVGPSVALSERVSFRVTSAEKTALCGAAKQLGWTLSALLKEVLRRHGALDKYRDSGYIFIRERKNPGVQPKRTERITIRLTDLERATLIRHAYTRGVRLRDLVPSLEAMGKLMSEPTP